MIGLDNFLNPEDANVTGTNDAEHVLVLLSEHHNIQRNTVQNEQVEKDDDENLPPLLSMEEALQGLQVVLTFKNIGIIRLNRIFKL